MIVIDDTIISDSLLEESFRCDLSACKGACCVEGDAGAPLEDEEVRKLKDIRDQVLPYLEVAGEKVIRKVGVYTVDDENDVVTPLVNNKECAYAIFEKGIAKCGIEKAYEAGAVDFRKPISCHLYPVRLSKHDNYTAVNVNKWTVCSAAYICGRDEKVPMHRFLQDALTRRFGNDWYEALDAAYEQSC